MSKISITPNASGTGVFTISSPATNTNRSLTLPDEAGSIVVNTATGIDVTGTVTADGLTVDGTSPSVATFNSTSNGVRVEFNGASTPASRPWEVGVLNNADGDFQIYQAADAGAGDIKFYTDGALRQNIDAQTGDISFYEDTGTTAKFFWDASAESLGIGTSSPSLGSNGTGLHIKGASGDYGVLKVDSSTTSEEGWVQFSNNGVDKFRIASDSSTNLKFIHSGVAERMRITSSGKVIIGTEPDDTYSQGWSSIDGIQDSSRDSTASRTHYEFRNPNGAVGTIATSGSSTAYNTSSDYRLKTDAQPMTGASARVLALNPVNFEWISSGERVDGFLAHEAQAIVPECVTGTKDAMRDEQYEVTAAVYEDIIIAAVLDEEGNELAAERTEQRLVTEAVMGTRSVPDMQGIDQSKLVPLLTAALQEALTEISALKVRVAALEAV
jgi:hypothetical protein